MFDSVLKFIKSPYVIGIIVVHYLTVKFLGFYRNNKDLDLEGIKLLLANNIVEVVVIFMAVGTSMFFYRQYLKLEKERESEIEAKKYFNDKNITRSKNFGYGWEVIITVNIEKAEREVRLVKDGKKVDDRPLN